MSEEKFEGADGLNIFVRSWRPDGKARAVVAIVHGVNSHSGYLHVGGRTARGQRYHHEHERVVEIEA